MGVNAVALDRGSEAHGVVTRGGRRSTTCQRNFVGAFKDAVGGKVGKEELTYAVARAKFQLGQRWPAGNVQMQRGPHLHGTSSLALQASWEWASQGPCKRRRCSRRVWLVTRWKCQCRERQRCLGCQRPGHVSPGHPLQ